MSSTGGSGYNPYSQGSNGWSILRNEEFQEVDVWGVSCERKEIDSISTGPITISSMFSRGQPPTATRMIPNPKSISSSNEPNTCQRSSAPVNIPDWSKIYGKNLSGDVSSWIGSGGGGGRGGGGDGDWDSDEEDDEIMVPPHEWIARKVARSQISSFSVYEGVGRTLKGRDLSNVRNAVLSKTGFLE